MMGFRLTAALPFCERGGDWSCARPRSVRRRRWAHDRGARFGDNHEDVESRCRLHRTIDPAGNHVVAFARDRDGTITQEQSVATAVWPGRATSVRLSNHYSSARSI